MLQVYVKPEELWEYFQKHKKRFEDAMDNIAEVVDAEAEDSLIKIYLTEEKGYPSMTVEQVFGYDDEEVLAKECAISANDCSEVYRKFLNRLDEYDKKVSGAKSVSSSGVDETDLQIVLDRSFELKEALAVFLNTLMGYESDEGIYGDEELAEILDNIEVMMYQEFGYVAYHPQIIECNGQMKLVEFPYDEENDLYGETD